MPQIPYIHKLVEAFRIPVFIQDGQEADDVIATLARKAIVAGMEVVIVTGDKDMLQLVGPGVSVYDSLKEKTYGPAEVEERFGVPPERVVEIMGLMGDARTISPASRASAKRPHRRSSRSTGPSRMSSRTRT